MTERCHQGQWLGAGAVTARTDDVRVVIWLTCARRDRKSGLTLPCHTSSWTHSPSTRGGGQPIPMRGQAAPGPTDRNSDHEVFLNQYVVPDADKTMSFSAHSLTCLGIGLHGMDAPDGSPGDGGHTSSARAPRAMRRCVLFVRSGENRVIPGSRRPQFPSEGGARGYRPQWPSPILVARVIA